MSDRTRPAPCHRLDQATFAALWVNPVYICTVSPESSVAERRALAAAVGVNGVDVPLDEHPNAAVRLARHCCIVTEDMSDPVIAVTTGLIAVHHVCWSAALILDATLNHEVELVGLVGRVPPDVLERQATRVSATFILVQRFRLGYSAVEAHLETTAALLWQALEKAWKFERVLQNVDDRLSFVRTLHGQLQARLQDGRSRVLNEIVLVFTFLNLFSLALASFTFAGLPAIYARAAPTIAIALVLAANLTAYLWFRRRYYAR